VDADQSCGRADRHLVHVKSPLQRSEVSPDTPKYRYICGLEAMGKHYIARYLSPAERILVILRSNTLCPCVIRSTWCSGARGD
jgi:hypothetical protein